MNIKKIEKQLKKINQLFDTIKEDGTVSPIEKDLMLSYIRGLYEKIVISEHNSSEKNEKTDVKTKAKKEVIEVKQVREVEALKVEETYTPTNNIADVVMQEVADADLNISENAPSAQMEPVFSAPAPQQVAVKEVVEVIEPPKPRIPDELAELFKSVQVNELSDKLSRAPITDLSKCMGINEKIFTVQELFGGDSALFTKSMETMDTFSSIEQARDYLVEHVALDQNWSEVGKLKKAANFVKLISRRY